MKTLSLRRFWIVLLGTVAAVLAMAFFTPLPVDAQDSSAPTATVVPWGLNLRAGPGMSYRVLDVLRRGAVVELVGYRTADTRWVQVKTKDNLTGWAGARHLKSDYPFKNLKVIGTVPPVEDAKMVATVKPCALNVREGPGTTYKVIGWVSRGEEVKLAGYRNADASWVQVHTPRGVTGWVSSYYLRTDYPVMSLPVMGDVDNLTGTTPAQVVESFYSWYLEYARDTGNPVVNHAYRTQTHLTADFIDRLDQMVAQGLQADPILCAQDIPGEIRIGATRIDGTTATVVVHQVWNPGTDMESIRDISVVLRKVGGHWKIDNVQCK